MGNLDGKVVVITGAAQGLGEADARILTERGARVVMTDINDERGEAVAKDIGADYRHQDVSDEDSWDELMSHINARYDRLDVLVNNAGIAVIANIESTTTQQWSQTLNIHLNGTFFGCQRAVQLMKKDQQGGSIINMSSVVALQGYADYIAYAAAKGAIRSMTKSIAAHCLAKGYNIRCNSIYPGSISAPMVHAALAHSAGIDFEAAQDPEALRLQLGIGEPNDVAHMVAFLASDEAKHINAAEFVVDNGMSSVVRT